MNDKIMAKALMLQLAIACSSLILAALVGACDGPSRIVGTPTGTPTLAPIPTAGPRFDLPSGYTAYPNVTVVVVDISPTGTEGAAAQESIIRQATAEGIDVLVLGCLTVDDAVSVCPTTPFLIRGSANVGAKRALR